MKEHLDSNQTQFSVMADEKRQLFIVLLAFSSAVPVAFIDFWLLEEISKGVATLIRTGSWFLFFGALYWKYVARKKSTDCEYDHGKTRNENQDHRRIHRGKGRGL